MKLFLDYVVQAKHLQEFIDQEETKAEKLIGKMWTMTWRKTSPSDYSHDRKTMTPSLRIGFGGDLHCQANERGTLGLANG